jgi:hypothetical protein
LVINAKKYIEKFLKIRDKESRILGLRLNKPQMKLYTALRKQNGEGKPMRAIVLKARQMGFSTLTEAIIFKRTATAYNVTSAIVTHEDKATANLFEMSKRYYRYLPDILKPRLKASNAREVVFDDKKGAGLGSRIKCFTAGGEGIGRSDTIQNLHISELAFWPGDKADVLTGILQSVPNSENSMVVIESTANGYDYFKKIWDMSVAGENDFTPVFCAWWELPEYRAKNTIKELTDEEKRLKADYKLDLEQLSWRRWCIASNCGGDEARFKQEYPSNPHEAFIYSGSCVFDKTALIAQIERKVKPIKTGYFKYEEDVKKFKDGSVTERLTNIRFIESKGNDAIIRIYEDVKPGYPYVIGGDTAGEGSDYFTAQVLNNVTGRQAAVLTQRTDEDLYAKQAYCLGKYYNTALLAPETNFSTYPIQTLERYGYEKLYVREQYDDFTHGIRQSYGFRTTSTSRPILIAALTEVFREDPALISDEATLKEMLVFVRNERGRAEAMRGEHDDHVIALGIAYAVRGQQRVTVEIEKESKDDVLRKNFNIERTDGNGYTEW